jgi:hypothetical protein
MELIGVLSNHDLQGSLDRLVKKLAAVRASGGPLRQAVACRQRARRPGWVLKAVVQVLADRASRCEPRTSMQPLRRRWGGRWRGLRSRLLWLPTSRVLRPASCEWQGAGTCWRAARRASSLAARRRKLRLSDRMPDRQGCAASSLPGCEGPLRRFRALR